MTYLTRMTALEAKATAAASALSSGAGSSGHDRLCNEHDYARNDLNRALRNSWPKLRRLIEAVGVLMDVHYDATPECLDELKREVNAALADLEAPTKGDDQ